MSAPVTLRETERALIAVLLTEPRTIIPVSALLREADFTDTLCRRVFTKVVELAQAHKVPNAFTVASTTESVTLEALNDIVRIANPRLVQEVKALAKVIADEATYRRVQTVAERLAATAVQRPPDLATFVYDAQRTLGEAVQGKADRPSDLATIADEVEQLIADENGLVGIPTGMSWLTNRIGGIRPGRIAAIVAPYKSRKSTLARNMVLAGIRAKRNICVYLLEGDRATFYMDLWAMLATDYMHRSLTENDFLKEAHLDAEHLARKLRTTVQHDALEEARKELADLTPYLHISDGRDGIGQLTQFTARLQRDRFLYHSEMVVLDHLQLMTDGSHKLFETVENTVKVIQSFASSEGVAALILSQKNEASIDDDDDDESYSPGVKGGGALAAAADYIVTVRYDGKHSPNFMQVKLKLTRRAQPGTKTYLINPSSGLILSQIEIDPAPARTRAKGTDWRTTLENAEES